MYLTFAISILAFWLVENHTGPGRFKTILFLVLIVNFYVFVVLLNSKAGWITLFMILAGFLYILVVVKRKWKVGIVALLSAVLLFGGCLLMFPVLSERALQSGKDLRTMESPGKDPKSTAERIATWGSSCEIIAKHPFYGVGTGDVKDALMEQYKAHGYSKILSQKLDSHNQYLQTFIALGVFGLALLLYLLFMPAIRAFQRRDLISLSFILIFAMNISVESMLENQAGVVFYALFNSMLFVFYRYLPGENPYEFKDNQGNGVSEEMISSGNS